MPVSLPVTTHPIQCRACGEMMTSDVIVVGYDDVNNDPGVGICHSCIGFLYDITQAGPPADLGPAGEVDPAPPPVVVEHDSNPAERPPVSLGSQPRVVAGVGVIPGIISSGVVADDTALPPRSDLTWGLRSRPKPPAV